MTMKSKTKESKTLPQLYPESYLVYGYLLGRAAIETALEFPGYDQMQNVTGLSRSVCVEVIRQLEHAGLIGRMTFFGRPIYVIQERA